MLFGFYLGLKYLVLIGSEKSGHFGPKTEGCWVRGVLGPNILGVKCAVPINMLLFYREFVYSFCDCCDNGSDDGLMQASGCCPSVKETDN